MSVILFHRNASCPNKSLWLDKYFCVTHVGMDLVPCCDFQTQRTIFFVRSDRALCDRQARVPWDTEHCSCVSSCHSPTLPLSSAPSQRDSLRTLSTSSTIISGVSVSSWQSSVFIMDQFSSSLWSESPFLLGIVLYAGAEFCSRSHKSHGTRQ